MALLRVWGLFLVLSATYGVHNALLERKGISSP